jgi:F420-dependent oxidoreductase-like protein
MRFRIFTEPQQGATYADQLRFAMATEELGYDAFFRSDHYLAIESGAGLPGPTDAFITLAGLARQTSRIRLGTLVTPVTFRLPGPLAIAVAQIDEMSGGRIELGLGAGWFAREHAAYGIPFPPLTERFEMLAEQLAIIDGLWRAPEGHLYQFAGTQYELADSPALPKPAQYPRPPIILGGRANSRSASLAARYADEYNVGFSSAAETRQLHDRIRVAVAEYGREADTMVYSAAQTVAVGAGEAQARARAAAIGRELDDVRNQGLGGTASEVVDKLGAFAEAGATTAYLQILDLADLDQVELLASQVLPQV